MTRAQELIVSLGSLLACVQLSGGCGKSGPLENLAGMDGTAGDGEDSRDPSSEGINGQASSASGRIPEDPASRGSLDGDDDNDGDGVDDGELPEDPEGGLSDLPDEPREPSLSRENLDFLAELDQWVYGPESEFSKNLTVITHGLLYLGQQVSEKGSWVGFLGLLGGSYAEEVDEDGYVWRRNLFASGDGYEEARDAPRVEVRRLAITDGFVWVVGSLESSDRELSSRAMWKVSMDGELVADSITSPKEGEWSAWYGIENLGDDLLFFGGSGATRQEAKLLMERRDADGNVIWSYTGEAQGGIFDRADLVLHREEMIYVLGTERDSEHDPHQFQTMAFDTADGTLKWSKRASFPDLADLSVAQVADLGVASIPSGAAFAGSTVQGQHTLGFVGRIANLSRDEELYSFSEISFDGYSNLQMVAAGYLDGGGRWSAPLLVGGNVEDSGGASRMFLAEYNAQGVEQWSRVFLPEFSDSSEVLTGITTGYGPARIQGYRKDFPDDIGRAFLAKVSGVDE